MSTISLDGICSPIQHLSMPETENYIDIKREDLLPFSFGGNKVRIAREFIDDMRAKGKNCLIGYGNPRSNLSRALANICAAEGVHCRLLAPSEEHGGFIETSNSRLVASFGTEVHRCEKYEVAPTVDAVMKLCEKAGERPYYIYGDCYGEGNEATPVRAYAKTYREIPQNTYDYIFLATGTGMTQSGLIAGSIECGGTEKIIGISIARSKEKAESVIAASVEAYFSEQSKLFSEKERICVEDAYLCGEYGLYDDSIEQIIVRMFREHGLPLDPTYTGKAFHGMLSYLQEHEINRKKILFLHTGGTPLFFDYLTKQSEEGTKK